MIIHANLYIFIDIVDLYGIRNKISIFHHIFLAVNWDLKLVFQMHNFFNELGSFSLYAILQLLILI